MSLINLSHVSKCYRNYYALKDINLTVQRGEMIAIVGASGSGKSTLMNMIGLLDRATEGVYSFAGIPVTDLSLVEWARIRNQKMGFVFQAFFLLPRLTVLQNVMLPLFYRGMETQAAQTLALAMLKKVSMETFALRKPNQLSGGQQQRVAIARALVGDAEVILADEPTGSLDSRTGQEVMDLFLALNKQEQKTLILVTHDKAISQQCQRTLLIKDGCIV